MAKVRIGFSTQFEVENETVGIGTDSALDTLHVTGDITAHNIDAGGGITTVTTYQGFIDKEVTLTNTDINLDSKAHSLSGEIIIEGDITVSSATTVTSGPENLTVTDNFTLPGISDDKPSAGTTRFNENLRALEFYTGVEWKAVNSRVDMGNSGRGIWGNGSGEDDYHFIQIPTLGNSEEFGTFYQNDYAGMGAFSNGSRGLWCGGVNSNKIEYLTIQSKGNAIDFGNLFQTRDSGGSCSSSTRGVIGAGINRSPLSNTNVIDYVEIATLGDAKDFGDMSYVGGYNGDSFSSPIRGFFAGGGYPSATTDINVITIASKGDSTKFGDQSTNSSYQGQASNNTRGITAGGMRYSPYRNNASIEYVTMASEGDTTTFGDLTLGRHSPAAVCTHVRACFAGGYTQEPSVGRKLIDYIQFASTGNAMDFGELSVGTYMSFANGTSDSHGGLGGF